MSTQPENLGNVCGTCRHWDWESDNENFKKTWEELTGGCGGLCRRHPPRPLIQRSGDDGKAYVLWPNTAFNDYCGEHLPKLQPTQKHQ